MAELARIKMAESELEELRGELEQIVEFVGAVQAADASSVPELPLSEHRNIWRDDGAPHEAGKFSADIIANFPSSEKGYLKVKKILDK